MGDDNYPLLIKLICLDAAKDIAPGNSIYIGPRRNNLAKSIWYFPEAVSLYEYGQLLLARLKSNALNAKEIFEKRSICCFCDEAKRCHGNVLIYILLSQETTYTCRPVHIFAVSTINVFSNTYKHSFLHYGKIFFSLAHAYYFWLGAAKHFPVNYLTKIVQSSSFEKLTHIWYKCIPRRYHKRPSKVEKILLIYELLSIKWVVCTEFREKCIAFSKNLLVQDAPNGFWGRGLHGKSIQTYNGENIGGWLIMIICEERIFETGQEEMFHQLKNRIIFATKGMVNCAFLRGLKRVLSIVSSPTKRKECAELFLAVDRDRSTSMSKAIVRPLLAIKPDEIENCNH